MIRKLALTLLAITSLVGCDWLDNQTNQAPLAFSNAWMRAAPPGANVAVVYGNIINNSDSDISVIAAYSPAFGAIEFHQTVKQDGLARMQRRPFIQVAARSEKALQPGGLHLMLFRPQTALQAGDKIWLCLEFSNGQLVEQWLPIKKQ